MNKVQTDNSYFYDKVSLRSGMLDGRESLRVLDAFAGDGRIRKEVEKRLRIPIELLRIDMKPGKSGVYLRGDNRKFLSSMDLGRFDVIDLDAYGVPFPQLEMVFSYASMHSMNAMVFVTYIQVMHGQLPKRMLCRLGYSKAMLDKIPTLFFRDGFDKFKKYLSACGVREIVYRGEGKKHYVGFQLLSTSK